MSKRRLITDPYFSQTVLSGKGRLRSPNRAAPGQGMYKAPRSDLRPGAVTRREWLRFMSYIQEGEQCLCTPGVFHRHWIWGGWRTKQGYGSFRWRGRMYLAHRFACIAMGRSIPNGQEPDHLCRVTYCCNPACIDVVLQSVNILRGSGICACHARQTHCKWGHLLEGDNLLPAPWIAEGHRICRACAKKSKSEQWAHRRATVGSGSICLVIAQKTHCKRGHLFTEENLDPYLLKHGIRKCRRCRNLQIQRAKQRKKLQEMEGSV